MTDTIKNYTDHIIRDRVHIIREILSRYDEPTPKYLTDEQLTQVQTDTDEQDTTAAHPGCAPGFNLEEHQQLAETESHDTNNEDNEKNNEDEMEK